MARNVDKGSTRKVHPTGVVPHAVGPVNNINDAAKFTNKGSFSGKTPANGVEEQAKGCIFHENSTHIPTMNADKPAKESKVISSRAGGAFGMTDTSSDLTASQTGDGGPTNKPYPLAQRYDKKGQTESKKVKNVL
jgi:hypothetical protein